MYQKRPQVGCANLRRVLNALFSEKGQEGLELILVITDGGFATVGGADIQQEIA
jgi:hypothetical protein